MRSRLATGAVAVSAAAGAIAIAAAGPVQASVSRASVGSVTPQPANSWGTGPTSAAKRLSVTVELQPRDALSLKRFATAVSTPGTPAYGHYLSVAQFRSRFAASTAHAAAVAHTLRGDGLTVGGVTRNGMELTASGTVAQMEKTFAVREGNVREADGRMAYANNVAPTLPSSVAPYVQGVMGLDDLTPQQPAGLQSAREPDHAVARAHGRGRMLADGVVRKDATAYPTGGPQPCGTALAYQSSDVNGEGNYPGYTADQLATAYGFNSLYSQGDLGAGQTVALVEEEQFNQTNVATYGACYTLGGAALTIAPQVVNVSGGPGNVPDEGEAELDIEVIASMAPKASIIVYQGAQTNAAGILNAIVSANAAKVISDSWGACESLTGAATINAENTALQEAAAQGQSFFISSGDAGSSMCWQATATSSTPNDALSVIDPGGQPFATGVGGTALYTGSLTGGTAAYYQAGNPVTQGVWNDGEPQWDPQSNSDNPANAAGGGGLSSFFAMPSYQSSAPATLGVTNAGSSPAPCGASSDCREVPDVSADADSEGGYVVNTVGNTRDPEGWGTVGGTSAAAPLWAAYVALANASPTCRGLSLGFVNPSLYATAASAYGTNFYDPNASTPNPFTGATNNDAFSVGDNAVGGDPNQGQYPELTGYDMATGLGSMTGTLWQSMCALRAPVYTVGVTTPAAQTTTVGTPVSLQVAATDSGGAALGYSATGLPAGLVISPTTGLITGTPTTVGVSTVTVTAGDSDANSGASQAFSWTVAAPAVATTPPPVTTTKSTTNKPSGVKLAGLGKGRPTLSFDWNVAAGSPALTALAVKLPKGLSFAKLATVRRDLKVTSSGKRAAITVTLKRGVVVIALKHKATRLAVSFAKGALKITKAEATKVKKKKVKSLKLTVTATNAKRKRITSSVTVTQLS